MVRSLQKKLSESTQCHNRTIEELQQERLLNQQYNANRATSVPDFASVDIPERIDGNFVVAL